MARRRTLTSTLYRAARLSATGRSVRTGHVSAPWPLRWLLGQSLGWNVSARVAVVRCSPYGSPSRRSSTNAAFCRYLLIKSQ
jgi:hypothetical protein